MLYICSDLHAEYDLFTKLLEKIGFSDKDRMIVCGDIIDKGKDSVRLAKRIFSMPNVECIMGNHEYAFLKLYRARLSDSPNNFDSLLAELRGYFPEDGHLLDWETVDRLDSLPLYIEEEDFICVHSGLPLDKDGKILPLENATAEQLVYDRRFKNADAFHTDKKCVFFGHTQTDCVYEKPIILGYLHDGSKKPEKLTDFYKIHLDTGTWSNGVMSCFCVDTLKAYYVKK